MHLINKQTNTEHQTNKTNKPLLSVTCTTIDYLRWFHWFSQRKVSDKGWVNVWLIFNFVIMKLFCNSCFLLTLNIQRNICRITATMLVLSQTVVIATVSRGDHGDVVGLLWSHHRCCLSMCLNPGVAVHWWVGNTAAGQSHRSSLKYLTIRAHRNRGLLWRV